MDKPLNAQPLSLIYGWMVSTTGWGGKGGLLHARVHTIKHKHSAEREKKVILCLNLEFPHVRIIAYLTGPITPGATVISTASASQLHAPNHLRRETVLCAALKGES